MTRRARMPHGPVLAVVLGMVGCTHNHYYYTSGAPVAVEMADASGVVTDPCAPAAGRVSAARGAKSSTVGRASPAVVGDSSPVVVRRSTPMMGRRLPSGDTPSRVVISQPMGGAVVADRDRNGWSPVAGPFDPEPKLSTRGTSSAVDPTRNR